MLERLNGLRDGVDEGVGELKQELGELSVSRRRLLKAIPGAAGLAAVAGAAGPAAAGVSRAVALPRPRDPHASPSPTRKPESTQAPAKPVAVTVQKKPIFDLTDYRKATGAAAFPTDAIALTIDDGPHPVWTPKILGLLEKYDVPATFCMIGNQVLGHEGLAKSVTGAGHQLANHTWSHPLKLTGKTPEQVRKEIARAQAKIHGTTGATPKLFRSPGGDWSPMVLQEAAKAGLVPLDWSDDPRDWSRPGVPHIKSKLMAAKPGEILLCHDGGGDRSQTYAALSAVLPALKAKGFNFVEL